MQCENCGMELEEGGICPNCSKTTEEKKVAKRLKVMKILTFCLAGVILVGALLSAICYGLTGRFFPGKNDIYYKASYSASVKKLATKAGDKNFMKTRDTVVATMGEHQLTNRMLQVYYWDTVGNAGYADLNSDIALDQQYQDPGTGKTWQQFFIELAIESWRRDMLVLEMAQKAGFTMPQDYASQFATLEQDMITTAASKNYTSLEGFIESMLGRGTDFVTYYNYLWNYFLGGTYWAEYITTIEVDEEALNAYYEANKSSLVLDEYFQVTKDTGNLVDVRHILIKPEADLKDADGKATGSSEEAWEACRVKAQEILDAWLAGEHTEDSFAALAKEKTEDGGSKSNGGLYTSVWPGKMVQPFNDWCFDESRVTGDYGLVKTSYGYHIMFFVGAEEGWIRLCTPKVQSQLASEMMDQVAAQTVVNVDYKKIVLADIE